MSCAVLLCMQFIGLFIGLNRNVIRSVSEILEDLSLIRVTVDQCLHCTLLLSNRCRYPHQSTAVSVTYIET